MTLRQYLKDSPFDTFSFAEKLGVSEGAVHKWAYGQREPSLAMAMRIVAASGGQIQLQTLIKAKAA